MYLLESTAAVPPDIVWPAGVAIGVAAIGAVLAAVLGMLALRPRAPTSVSQSTNSPAAAEYAEPTKAAA